MKKLSERKRKWIERTVANDRSNKRFLYNRFYTFALLVLLQIAGLILLMYLFAYDTQVGVLVQLGVGILAVAYVLRIINQSDRPSARMNWVLLILIFPIVGVPLYTVCREGRPAWKLRKKIEEAKADNERRLHTLFGDTPIREPAVRADAVSYYLHAHADYPAYSDGAVEYYDCGEKMFPAMKEALRSAKKFILLEYFIVAHGKMWGQILEILLQKAEEGVQIRIIYDDMGCMTTLPPQYDRYLESLHPNIRAHTFNEVVPLFALRMNNRDHRKILVVDGRVAFTGGINLADEYIGEKRRFGYWKDTGVRVMGSAVASFTKMFFYLWNAVRTDGEGLENYVLPAKEGAFAPAADGFTVQPYDDCPLDEKPVGESVYVDILHRAAKYVYIFTPYLLLGDTLRTALCHAAERGVDVRIVVPGSPDKKTVYRLTRANYRILLEAGVKIYEYTPGFIHAKSFVCDDECAVVGTVNLDYRSLYQHFEDGVYFANCQAVLDLKRDCEETFAISHLCTKENTKRSLFGQLIDSLLRVFETLL